MEMRKLIPLKRSKNKKGINVVSRKAGKWWLSEKLDELYHDHLRIYIYKEKIDDYKLIMSNSS